jgi:hypothetical protein
MHRTQRGEGVVGRIETDTVVAGLIAGTGMAVLEMIASVIAGQSALLPLRSAASIVLHESAFGPDVLLIALVGAVIHFSIATMYAFAFGVFNTQLPWITRIRAPVQALLGMAFASLIWLLDFQFIARFFYPWMLDHSQLVQWLLHAVGFGLPLGVLYAQREPPLRVGEKPEKTS